MITGPDLTPEQRARQLRSYRLSAISGVVFAIAFMAIGLIDVMRARASYGYINIALAALWFPVAWMNWSRLRKLSA